jgi:hypothetical protein
MIRYVMIILCAAAVSTGCSDDGPTFPAPEPVEVDLLSHTLTLSNSVRTRTSTSSHDDYQSEREWSEDLGRLARQSSAYSTTGSHSERATAEGNLQVRSLAWNSSGSFGLEYLTDWSDQGEAVGSASFQANSNMAVVARFTVREDPVHYRFELEVGTVSSSGQARTGLGQLARLIRINEGGGPNEGIFEARHVNEGEQTAEEGTLEPATYELWVQKSFHFSGRPGENGRADLSSRLSLTLIRTTTSPAP